MIDLGDPATRNRLGLHSPSLAALGRCTCRRCRRHRAEAARLDAIGPEHGPREYVPPWIPHDDDCPECDRRRAAAAALVAASDLSGPGGMVDR